MELGYESAEFLFSLVQHRPSRLMVVGRSGS
jgi:hypothetical protein